MNADNHRDRTPEEHGRVVLDQEIVMSWLLAASYLKRYQRAVSVHAKLPPDGVIFSAVVTLVVESDLQPMHLHSPIKSAHLKI